jgi:hypothetical protein
MSVSLEEALSQVDLEEGRTYECVVKGRKVQVRVVKSLPPPPPIDVEDGMSDLFIPSPPYKTSGVLIRARPGKLPPPDPIEIPRDEDEP